MSIDEPSWPLKPQDLIGPLLSIIIWNILTALKEMFYPVPVKKTPIYFNQIKKDRLTKVNSKNTRLTIKPSTPLTPLNPSLLPKTPPSSRKESFHLFPFASHCLEIPL